MKKSIVTSLLLITILSCPVQSQPVLQNTKYFEFYNEYWINLHHFLYQKAKGSQLSKLEEDRMDFLDIGEDAVILNTEEDKVIKKAVFYYKKNLVSKRLRSELGDIRVWLQQQASKKIITDTTFSSAFTNILNEASDVYRLKYWAIHKEVNVNTLDNHIETIRSIESVIISKMEKMARYKWPKGTKVRVDLTVYANYAGAYTATRPKMNIVLSTIDPLNNTSDFIETIFHEGSHILYNYQDSPFREEIFYQAKEMGMNFPRNLWHASLSYLCGRATQDALKNLSIDHKLDMDVRNIFIAYNTKEFRNILEKYYQGKIDMTNTVSQLLSDLKNK